MTPQVRLGVTQLRVVAASVFVIHGITRTANGTVGGFGGFLESWGFPGGASLAAGYGVRALSAWFVIQIAAGILMVPARNGWFVVGAGSGSAEYSVLIIASLVAVALTDPVAHQLGRSG